jgi:hypothetical protein
MEQLREATPSQILQFISVMKGTAQLLEFGNSFEYRFKTTLGVQSYSVSPRGFYFEP